MTDLNTNNFPEELSCLEPNNVTPQYDASACACENVRYFITTMGYDWNITTDRPFIVAGFNAWLNPTIDFTQTQVQAWITECSSAAPDQADLIANGLPLSLQCPVPATTEQQAVTAAYMQAQCQSNNLIVALTGAVAQYNQALEQSADEWEAAFRQNCMSNLPGRETFTMTHTENEYYYTLYYYDQAGNLVQTVPPEGVDFLNATEITAVQNYRIPVGAPGYNPAYSPVYPSHTMVTRYKYNSLQQVIESETPDGGLTTFWYDALGRPVLSQDARQAAFSPTPAYSYVVYDELGRVNESGEFFNTTPITWAISHDRDLSLSFQNWRSASTGKREVTYTYYDVEHNSTSVTAEYGSNWQENLRNRVSAVWYRKDPAVACSSGVDAATFYTYDIHGNVKTLVSETNINDRLYYIDENLKRTDYHYDLWSGNVNEVVYQQGEYDEFRHRYYYDADNRLIATYSSKNGIIWEKECKQFYYAYGPLARTELGDRQVQGTDYAYTILGWVKGANSNTLSPARDMGKDGANTTGNLNRWFGYDAAAYSLGYFTNDYKAIDATLNNTANSFLASETNNPTNGYKQNSYDLYNGNISRMVTVMRDASGSAIPVQGRTFRYDQLNRIKEVNAWTDANVITSNNWSAAAVNNDDYYEAFTFDMNGNIETAVRNGNLTGTHQYMDNMTYLYTSGTNKLDYVNDLGLALSMDYGMDIDAGQTTGNYQYDATGNLIKDVSEDIDNIEWSSQGKITKITRSNTSNKSDLEFLYDATGQRVAKIVKPRVSGTLQTEDKWIYTVYARDASGDVMAVYQFDYKTMVGNNNYRIQYDLKEQHIYGGSRLGMNYDQQAAVTRDFTLAIGANGKFDFMDQTLVWNTTTQLPVVSTVIFERDLGFKAYELSNHLGNVLATVSDRRIPVGSAGVISHFIPEVFTYTDYYAFGSSMPGRTYVSANGKYRYGFDGQEKDDEITGIDGSCYTADFWQYDSRLGRRWNVDIVVRPFESAYATFANNPIYYVDSEGDEPKPYPQNIQDGLNKKKQWAYTAAAKFDIRHNQVSFRRMDKLEGHDNTTFNSYHFYRVTSFHETNAKKEAAYHAKTIDEGNDPSTEYLQCSPTLNGMINRLYGWEGDQKIYKTEVEGENSIMSTMKAKGLTGAEKTFTGVDANGAASHNSKESPVKLNESIAGWAMSETGANGVGFFIVSVAGGYHSLLLVVDRRGTEAVSYRLLDQHGNTSTGASSEFDRLKGHTKEEIDAYMLLMIQSWYAIDPDDDDATDNTRYNSNIKLMELKRD